MPAIRSRMSSSSSMIRMSRAMHYLNRLDGRPLIADSFGSGVARLCSVRLLLFCPLARRPDVLIGIGSAERYSKSKAGANASAGIGLGVDQIDDAAMLLDDARDDGESEPGALFARGNIGLEQALPVFLGPA